MKIKRILSRKLGRDTEKRKNVVKYQEDYIVDKHLFVRTFRYVPIKTALHIERVR